MSNTGILGLLIAFACIVMGVTNILVLNSRINTIIGWTALIVGVVTAALHLVL